MAWTAPMTAVANAVFTAAQFNANVRDNLLETMPGKATGAGNLFICGTNNSLTERTPAGDAVNTSETTTSTSYVNLTTSGPAVTCLTGGNAFVFISGTMNSSVGTVGSEAAMSFAVSGATTVAASDTWSIYSNAVAANDNGIGGWHWVFGLTGGNNTFTAKYKVKAAATGTFLRRRIVVFPY